MADWAPGRHIAPRAVLTAGGFAQCRRLRAPRSESRDADRHVLIWEEPVRRHRFQERIEESIRLYDKVMIMLSEVSVQNHWVEREVDAAREREDRENRVVLFPIRIDNAVSSREVSSRTCPRGIARGVFRVLAISWSKDSLIGIFLSSIREVRLLFAWRQGGNCKIFCRSRPAWPYGSPALGRFVNCFHDFECSEPVLPRDRRPCAAPDCFRQLRQELDGGATRITRLRL